MFETKQDLQIASMKSIIEIVVQLKSEPCEGWKGNKMMMKMFLNFIIFFSKLIINITNVTNVLIVTTFL